MTRIAIRPHSAETASLLAGHGIHPILARILAARGVARPSELSTELTDLLPPTQLKGIDDAARYLADAIAAGKRLLIVADYDCDGATACAVGVRGLRMLGAQVGYIVPNRFEYGYGLSPRSSRWPRASGRTCSSPSTTASPTWRAWRRPTRWASTSSSPITTCRARSCPRPA